MTKSKLYIIPYANPDGITNGYTNNGPGTSYSVIATVSNGTVVTRIRKSVATANGYTWDKIRLSNGIEGYVATNYLELLHKAGISRNYTNYGEVNLYNYMAKRRKDIFWCII